MAVTLDPAVTDTAEFHIQIKTARQRAIIRKHNTTEGPDGLHKASNTGKLKQ